MRRVELGSEFVKLNNILRKILVNLNNGNYVIDVYHERKGAFWVPNNDVYAEMSGDDNNLFFNPDLTFNDRPDKNGNTWMTIPGQRFNEILLHELTHLHGSEDNTTDKNGNVHFPPWYMYAEEIEKLMNGGINAMGEYRKRKADVLAGCGCSVVRQPPADSIGYG